MVDKLLIKEELFFLKTPIIKKNIIAREINISGKIKLKFYINFYMQDYLLNLNYTYLKHFLQRLLLNSLTVLDETQKK